MITQTSWKLTANLLFIISFAGCQGKSDSNGQELPKKDSLISPAEARAADAIEEIGGYVERDSDGHVIAVVLREWEDESELMLLNGLTNLRRLNLSSSEITDSDLETLGQMKSTLISLERVDLSNTQVTENDLWHLRDLPNLKHIDVYNTQVPEAHVPFYYGRPKVSIEFFSVFESIERDDTGHKIVRIDFHQRTTDTDLRLLDKLTVFDDLTSLRMLDLSCTEVTDTGLKALARFTGLQVLDLSGTQVTDAGLKYLKALVNLTSLSVEDTQVTEPGVSQLEQALPNVEVSR